MEEWLNNENYKILGISTHNLEQFKTTYHQYKEVLGYIAIGPCFSTSTKQLQYDNVTEKEIKEILYFIYTNKIQQSIVFIGGINKMNLTKLYSLIYKDLQENKKIIENQFYYASISSFLKGELSPIFNFTEN
jgi:hypothetical protein